MTSYSSLLPWINAGLFFVPLSSSYLVAIPVAVIADAAAAPVRGLSCLPWLCLAHRTLLFRPVLLVPLPWASPISAATACLRRGRSPVAQKVNITRGSRAHLYHGDDVCVRDDCLFAHTPSLDHKRRLQGFTPHSSANLWKNGYLPRLFHIATQPAMSTTFCHRYPYFTDTR